MYSTPLPRLVANARWLNRSLVCVLTIVAGGCSGDFELADPDLSNLPAPALGLTGGAGPSEHVTGSGHFRLPGGELRTFAFSAGRQRDGSADGQFQINNRAFPAHAHGYITCFTVMGNDAWIGGIITSSNDPELVGLVSRWQVEDNGQGRNASPDRINQIPLGTGPGADLVYCEETPDEFTELHEVDSGNIEIHPTRP